MSENTDKPVPDDANHSDSGAGSNGDIKIAEIWIRGNQVELDALEGFWKDKFRAVGILDYCKDIVKKYKPIKGDKPKGSIVDYARRFIRRK